MLTRLPSRYDDASHVNREYKRRFGEPPIRDVERLQELNRSRTLPTPEVENPRFQLRNQSLAAGALREEKRISPDRVEPRCKKRRPKEYDLMNKPRDVLRKALKNRRKNA